MGLERLCGFRGWKKRFPFAVFRFLLKFLYEVILLFARLIFFLTTEFKMSKKRSCTEPLKDARVKRQETRRHNNSVFPLSSAFFLTRTDFPLSSLLSPLILSTYNFFPATTDNHQPPPANSQTLPKPFHYLKTNFNLEDK
jgi:hypothetical protein